MFSMVLMAALTTGSDMPNRGHRGGGGGCCGGGGCYGGMSYGGGCYGGGCYGGGCYGGMSYGGSCYGGGCYGGMRFGGCGGYGMSWGSGYSGGYALSPMIGNMGTPIVGGNGIPINPGTTQSFYYNGNTGNQANEATIIVHVPEGANLTIDGQPTQARSDRRVFQSPPLQAGKTYTYTLRGEWNRDGQYLTTKKTIEVRAGQPTEVTLNFGNANRANERDDATPPARSGVIPNEESDNQIAPARTRRTPPLDSTPAPRSFPTPPRD